MGWKHSVLTGSQGEQALDKACCWCLMNGSGEIWRSKLILSKKKLESRGHWESMQEEGSGDALTGELYPPLESLLPAPFLFRKHAGGKDPGRTTMRRVSYKIPGITQKMDIYVHLPFWRVCSPNIDFVERNAAFFDIDMKSSLQQWMFKLIQNEHGMLYWFGYYKHLLLVSNQNNFV